MWPGTILKLTSLKSVPSPNGPARRHCLKLDDDLLSGKLRIRFGCEIIGSHKTEYGAASDDNARAPNRGYSRAPMSRSALVGNNRKLDMLAITCPGPLEIRLAPIRLKHRSVVRSKISRCRLGPKGTPRQPCL